MAHETLDVKVNLETYHVAFVYGAPWYVVRKYDDGRTRTVWRQDSGKARGAKATAAISAYHNAKHEQAQSAARLAKGV